MDHTDFTRAKRDELVALANAMLRDEINLLEGVRKVCSLRYAVGEPDSKVFMTFRAIESETDHFPLGEVRSKYAKERLAQIDREMHAYLMDAKEDIYKACREIIEHFSDS